MSGSDASISREPTAADPDAGTPEDPEAEQRRLAQVLADAPKAPGELPRRSWWRSLGRTFAELLEDEVTDWAAALTFYGISSIFPGLLLAVSLLGLLGRDTTQDVITNLGELTPGAVRDILVQAVAKIQESQGTAGILVVLSFLVAFWSASGYVGAFMRASNAIFDVPEGRPIWKTLPLRVAITALTGVAMLASALTVVFTGRLAVAAGNMLGVGTWGILAWDVLKWPVLVLLIGLLFALLYWAAPNARPGGFRWITPGSTLAVFLWLLVSGGFAFYVANFGSYNETYGTIGGVIIFVIWLWLSNVAILLGVKFDAELSRSRAIAGGLPPKEEPYVLMRDVPKGADD